jgi:SH3-like domain-containing protein
MDKAKAIFMTLPAALLLLLPAWADALCVSAPEANLRQGPGTRYEKLWQVFRYMPFERIGGRGGWHRVKDVDGDTYWVFGRLVTSKYKCAVVKDGRANIRKGPGTNHAETPTSPALKYYSFKVLGTRGDWVHVEDEYGEKGWIFDRLLWVR